MQKKNKLLIYFCFFLFFLFLVAGFCFATALEVSYPHSSRASDITSSTTVPAYLFYVFYFGIFTGFFVAFLSLAYAGVLYILSPAMPSALAKAKDRIYGSFSGMLLLVLLYLIITTINPALSIFKVELLHKLPPPPPPPPPPPNVFLYDQPDCPNVSGISCDPVAEAMSGYLGCPGTEVCDSKTSTCGGVKTSTSSIPNLSAIGLSNAIQSVKITNDPGNNIYFFSVLYANPKYRGECLMIPYNAVCQTPIKKFASSADIYKYSLTPSGLITIYRNPNFDTSGGFFTITASDIQKAAKAGTTKRIDLNTTYFGPSADSATCTVPKDQQDCVKYDENGLCTQRTCPTLAEKSIGSIRINGNYLVVLVYYNQADPQSGAEVTQNGTWNLCQSFPSPDDINKLGPRQIKWEDIRNNGDVVANLPNWLFIFPIDTK